MKTDHETCKACGQSLPKIKGGDIVRFVTGDTSQRFIVLDTAAQEILAKHYGFEGDPLYVVSLKDGATYSGKPSRFGVIR